MCHKVQSVTRYTVVQKIKLLKFVHVTANYDLNETLEIFNQAMLFAVRCLQYFSQHYCIAQRSKSCTQIYKDTWRAMRQCFTTMYYVNEGQQNSTRKQIPTKNLESIKYKTNNVFIKYSRLISSKITQLMP